MRILDELRSAFQQLYTSGINNTITPSDTDTLEFRPRAVYVGGAGNLTIEDQEGNQVTFVGVPAGTILPIKPKAVKATGTTATDLVSLQ